MSKPFVTIELPQSEVQKFSQWAREQEATVQRDSKRIIQESLRHIHRLAVSQSPVNFGTLKQSIHVEISKDGLGGAVFTGRKYAPYMEWGTGSKVFVPSYVKQMFGVNSMDWKGAGIRKVNLKPHPYLFANALVGYNEMIQKLKALGFKEKGNKPTGNMRSSVIISNMTY